MLLAFITNYSEAMWNGLVGEGVTARSLNAVDKKAGPAVLDLNCESFSDLIGSPTCN